MFESPTGASATKAPSKMPTLSPSTAEPTTKIPPPKPTDTPTESPPDAPVASEPPTKRPTPKPTNRPTKSDSSAPVVSSPAGSLSTGCASDVYSCGNDKFVVCHVDQGYKETCVGEGVIKTLSNNAVHDRDFCGCCDGFPIPPGCTAGALPGCCHGRP
jgi:hypothetical protein